MTPALGVHLSGSLLQHLADAAARALLLGAFAGTGLFVLRVKATSARLFTWTVALYAALAMPLLGWMLPPLSIPAPAFLQFEGLQGGRMAQKSNAAGVQFMQASVQSGAPTSGVDHRLPAAQPAAPDRHRFLETGPAQLGVTTIIYLAVALVLFARLFVGSIFANRLLRSSQKIHDIRVTERLAAGAHSCGLDFVPPIAESEALSVPVTVGVLRSTILLPSGWREWEKAKLDSAIAHEVSHVARRDALTQRLSLLHRAVFWFSPLAWWLDRHLAELAEQASDEFALTFGVDRNDYARSLLGFFEALQAAPARVRWEAVAMATRGQAERQAEQRLERILAWKQAGGAIHMRRRKLVLAVVTAFAVPAVYLAASAHPTQLSAGPMRSPQASQPSAAGATLEQPSVPMSAPTTISGPHVPFVGYYSSLPPAAPTDPVAQTGSEPSTAASPAQSSSTSSSSGHRYSYAYGYDGELRFVIVTGNSDSLTMSGSTEDAHHVERLKKQIHGDFIWFQNDEKSYIIRDQGTVDRARQLWAPQEELGKKQEALGKQQEALGQQQEALGTKMEQVHVTPPDMSADLDRLKAELKQLSSSGATVDQLGKIQSEIGELQSKIGEIQSHAGDQQSKLGEQMSTLGEQQSRLGEQQGELGRQQGKLAEEASHKMKVLLDEALKNGMAKPESDGAPTL